MPIKLTLKTADGCTGTSTLYANGLRDTEPVVWDREPDAWTVSALFENTEFDGEDTCEIDGDQWRELEQSGHLDDIALSAKWSEKSLETIVDAALNGFWVDGLDLDRLRDLEEAWERSAKLEKALISLYQAGRQQDFATQVRLGLDEVEALIATL